MKKSPLDLYLLLPVKHFIERKTSAGLLLIFSAALAMIVANSPLADQYHNLWKQYIHIGFNEFEIRKNLLHWINDGLMSMFFFLIGLELKREIMRGQLSGFREAMLPVAAAAGGLIFPALLFLSLNAGTEAASGWGIPMATDIAFALGILYLLGSRVPFSLTVFLTAVAIVDDLGAVLVIALFYTSDISVTGLAYGGFFMLVLIAANYMGIRNTVFYGIVGIGGLWLAVLLSGVHATIAAVLAAFAIPMSRKIDTSLFLRMVKMLSFRIRKQKKEEKQPSLSSEDEISKTMEKFTLLTEDATPPLQHLIHSLHALVSFVVLPVFAFANAGVTIDATSLGFFGSPVLLGILLGLLVGKFLGIVLFVRLMTFFKISKLPKGTTWPHIYGLGLLSGIGFTMSFFITELAYENEEFLIQAKMGILTASVIAGISGYLYLKLAGRVSKKKTEVLGKS